MPDELHEFTRSTAVAEIAPEVSADGRTVTVRLVPWADPRRVVDIGQGPRGGYVESFARGGLAVPEGPHALVVEREHGGPVVGRLTATEDREDGLYGTIRLSRSTVGQDMAADLDEQIYRYVSVDFLDAPVPRNATNVVRSAARLRRVAFTLEPAHDAPVVSVRSNPNPEGTPTMPEATAPEAPEATAPEATAPVAQAPAPAPAAPELVGATRSRVQIPGAGDTATALASLGQFPTFGHFVRSAALGEIDGPELARYQRALADIVTADTTGLIQENWVAEIIDLQRQYTPTVQNWRSRPLPASGMSISQPIIDTRPTVGEQTTQKTDITSTDVVIDFVQWAIKTYAGGSDVSIQVIERSSPDLMSELMRLYTREMAQKVNAAATTALNAAAAVGVSGNAALEYVTPEAFDALVIAASASFLLPTKLRRPAEVMALSIDLWAALANARDNDDRPLYPSINPMNTHGRMDATSTSGNVMAVDWYVEPDLGTGIKGVIGVRDAFVTSLGPVKTLTADVPVKLGRDVAVYQEAAFGATDPRGLVQIVNVTP